MFKKLLFTVAFIWIGTACAQECPNPVLISPADGENNVALDATITWQGVDGVPGYILALGTTPLGTDILNRQNTGIATSFTPPLGLPENTQIYATITLFFFQNGMPEITCSSETFRTVAVTQPPSCTGLSSPSNAAVNINAATNISWNYSLSATGYRLTLGTAPGLGNILNNMDVGNALSYNPITDFPANTVIYVQVTPYNNIGDLAPCPEESFMTGAPAALPGCATLISPADGEGNVPLTPFLEWTDVAGATGYRVTIGTSPFTSEILDNVTFFTNTTFVIDFEPNRTFFITIIPFNAAGDAIDCIQQSFSTVLGCGPFFDSETGELVTLNPEINFPDAVSFCQNDLPFVVTSQDTADGFRWYRVDQFGNETLVSDTSEIGLTEIGQYRYEAYNLIMDSSGIIECETSKLFNVVASEIATINSINITEETSDLTLTVQVSGSGDYEFALDTIDGTYQDSNVFTAVNPGAHTVYVRDKNGCGIAEGKVEQDLTVEGFPKFFTPNGDGINDFWQFIPPPLVGVNTIDSIHIFDQYGKLLMQLDPTSQGWDGRFNGIALPASDYWFQAIGTNNQTITGHFAIKR